VSVFRLVGFDTDHSACSSLLLCGTAGHLRVKDGVLGCKGHSGNPAYGTVFRTSENQQSLYMTDTSSLWVKKGYRADRPCEFRDTERSCNMFPVRSELNLYMLCRRK
jgi:hypothetical protein